MFKKIEYKEDSILINLDNVCEIGSYNDDNIFNKSGIIKYFVYIQYNFSGNEDDQNMRTFIFELEKEQKEFLEKLEKIIGIKK